MNHLFAHKDISPGKKTVVEVCIHCDLKSRRYARNSRTYPDGYRKCTRPSTGEQNLRDRIGRMEKALAALKDQLSRLYSANGNA